MIGFGIFVEFTAFKDGPLVLAFENIDFIFKQDYLFILLLHPFD